jgi:hypothetical protein
VLVERGKARIFTRSGYDWSDRYPGIVRAAAKLHCQSAITENGLQAYLSLHFAPETGGGRRRVACVALGGAALFVTRPSKVPFIENNISLIEFAREKVA